MQNSNTLTFLSLETSLQKLSYLLCYAFNNRSFTFFFSSSFFSCIGYFMWSNKLQISSVQPKASVLFYNCIFVQMICNFYVFKKCSLNLTPPYDTSFMWMYELCSHWNQCNYINFPMLHRYN